MESNIKLVSASDNRLMAFRGEIKAERWVNCDIPAEFAAILLRASTCKSEVILLGLMFFKEEFLGLFEIAIGSIDERLLIPFPEDYRNKEDFITRRPVLMVRGEAKFNEQMPTIRINADFLLKWLHIQEAPYPNWWINYLKEEGYETPAPTYDIPLDKIQVLPPVIIKAAWVKGMNKNNMGASCNSAETSRTGKRTPHSAVNDVVDLLDMEDD
ncbi:hypothetical protein SUGI_0755420 [Cryptomeria japonica]|nr:hypothetical protein SUGI_0755420 [Cryptomeria japonica]